MKPQYSLYATHSQQNKIFFTKYYVKNIAFIKINIYNNGSPSKESTFYTNGFSHLYRYSVFWMFSSHRKLLLSYD